jgi:hypothetical protein
MAAISNTCSLPPDARSRPDPANVDKPQRGSATTARSRAAVSTCLRSRVVIWWPVAVSRLLPASASAAHLGRGFFREPLVDGNMFCEHGCWQN